MGIKVPCVDTEGHFIGIQRRGVWARAGGMCEPFV